MPATMYAPRINTNDDRVEVVAWHVQPGDTIEEGQELVDLETSKAVVTINAEASGHVWPLVPERSVVHVGEPFCVIGDSADAPEKTVVAVPVAVAATPVAATPPAPSTGAYAETRFSKAALKLLEETARSPESFKGSGLVTARRLRGDRPKPPVFSCKAPAAVASLLPQAQAPRSEHVSLAKAAEIASLSIGEAGNINSAVTVYFNSARIREHIRRNNSFAGNIQPILLYELSRLLKKWPQFTAFFDDGKIFYHDRADIGLAIDLGKGLKVVTLHDSASMLPVHFYERIGEIGLQYAENKIKPQDLVDSTFTVTDLSGFNVLQFHPLINGRQSAILGVGGDEAMPGHPMSLTLTFDHRVANGREAALFLNELRNRLLSYEPQGPGRVVADAGGTVASMASNRRCNVCGIEVEAYHAEFPGDACMLVTIRPDGGFGAICHRCVNGYV